MELSKLKVDKEDSSVKYNDELHKYWTKDGEMVCTSVTTLIHDFTTFDPEFWLSYKALEALLEPDVFKPIKSRLLNTRYFSIKIVTDLNISEEDFNTKRSEIKEGWDKKRDDSCERGTKIHLMHEMQHLNGQTKELKKLGLGGKFTTTTDNKIEGGKGLVVYPELLVSRISEDKKLRLAGQADLIIVDGWDVYILDYKTNAEIKTKGYFDQRTKKKSTMKYPLNNIEDTNFWHYTLQLSTYGWMIEKIDPRFNIKKLMLLHYDHDNNYTEYECEYRKTEVVRMLNYHKKQIEYEQFKKKREKIKF